MTTYRASRKPRHRGPAAWNAILGKAPAYPALAESRTADVVVIGAGFAGLSATLRLLQIDPALNVVVLEAGRIAEGAAGRNSGFMIDLPHELTSSDYAGHGNDAEQIRLNRIAIAFAKEAVDSFQIRSDYFDAAGKVNGAASPAADGQNRSYARHLKELGEVYETLDARQMHDLTGSHHYVSGLYTPGTIMLQPAGYIRGLAAGLSSQVSIHENAPVVAISRSGRDWCVATDAAHVTAPRIVMATNGHLESFGFAKGRLMHVFLYASMTPELDAERLAAVGGASRWGVTPSDPLGTTMRRIDSAQGGNRIVTRTVATLRSGMETSAGDLARATRVQQRKFDDRFPALAGLKPEFEWAGHLCLARNGVSVCGEIEDGIFSACVQNGLGTVRGTLTGLAAADGVLGQATDIRRHFEAQDAPSRLPPRPLRDIGANALLRWRGLRAGRE